MVLEYQVEQEGLSIWLGLKRRIRTKRKNIEHEIISNNILAYEKERSIPLFVDPLKPLNLLFSDSDSRIFSKQERASYIDLIMPLPELPPSKDLSFNIPKLIASS